MRWIVFGSILGKPNSPMKVARQSRLLVDLWDEMAMFVFANNVKAKRAFAAIVKLLCRPMLFRVPHALALILGYCAKNSEYQFAYAVSCDVPSKIKHV